MLKIAITGSTGLVGSRIVEILEDEFQFIPLTRHQIDITNMLSLFRKLDAIEYDYFLHLAAYTNVDGAEKDKIAAMTLNRDGTRNLFNAVHRKNKKFIYISTDFVFDGKTPPFYEDSIPHPISSYGHSKYEGEKTIANQAMVVRISYPYRKTFPAKNDFVRTVKTLLEQKKPLKMVTDSLIVPTFIDDIAQTMRFLIRHYKPGIYHVVGSQALSPFDAGKLIAQTYGLDASLIQPVTYDEYFHGKALRPKLSDIRSKTNTFHKMKSLAEGLQFMVKE
jgi:dTDP-4-dehydrorhamnose reductase